MIAYNNTWLNNLLVHNQAGKAFDQQCISAAEQQQVEAAYPVGFYTPNIFVRIGLFILTIVIVLFTIGLVSLLFLSASNEGAFGGLFLFFGFAAYGGLELMVSKGHYRSGVDDALLWASGCCMVGGLNVVTNISLQYNAILVLLLAAYLFLRFANAVMAAVAGLALLAALLFSLVPLGELAKSLAPFVLMAVAGLLYLFASRELKTGKWPHYENGFTLLRITALVCCYLAANYFVVREASQSMFNMYLKEGQDIALAWLFWLFTVAIPIIYIVRGLQKKDAVLLRVGLLLVAAIVFTVRNYYHVLPAETAMVIGGILFIVLAYVLIKYLHEPKHGFTSKEQQDAFFMDKLQVESLVIAQTFSGPATPDTGGTQFGGGSGSGGGASGTF